MARTGLLDVYCHERRRHRIGAICAEHQQSQLRGTARSRRTHVSVESLDSGGVRHLGADHRSPRADEVMMEPFLKIQSPTAIIPEDNIDTDQIIPARFLKTTEKIGLGRWLFADRR